MILKDRGQFFSRARRREGAAENSTCHPERGRAVSEANGSAESKDPYPHLDLEVGSVSNDPNSLVHNILLITNLESKIWREFPPKGNKLVDTHVE